MVNRVGRLESLASLVLILAIVLRVIMLYSDPLPKNKYRYFRYCRYTGMSLEWILYNQYKLDTAVYRNTGIPPSVICTLSSVCHLGNAGACFEKQALDLRVA